MLQGYEWHVLIITLKDPFGCWGKSKSEAHERQIQ